MSGGANINRDVYLSHLPAIIPIRPQALSFTSGAATLSTDFLPATTILRFSPTVDCYISFGENPVATSSDIFIFGGVIQHIGIPPGTRRISVIGKTSSGELNLVEGQ